MAGLFGASSTTNQANTLGDLSKDVALSAPPDDSVSDISFSPQSEHLAVASWDKQVRIYEINSTGGSAGKAFFTHEAPVLSCHWSPVSIARRINERNQDLTQLGRNKSCGSRSRQGCTCDRPRRRPEHRNPSCRTRPTYTLRTVF